MVKPSPRASLPEDRQREGLVRIKAGLSEGGVLFRHPFLSFGAAAIVFDMLKKGISSYYLAPVEIYLI